MFARYTDSSEAGTLDRDRVYFINILAVNRDGRLTVMVGQFSRINYSSYEEFITEWEII